MAKRRCRGRKSRSGRRMFWRVYLHGIVLLIAVTVGVGMANKALLGAYTPPIADAERLAMYVDSELTPLLDDAPALQNKLSRMREIFETDVAIYPATGGRALAHAGDPAPEPLREVPSEPFLRRDGGRHLFAVPVASGRAYLVGHVEWRHSPSRWLFIPGVVLLVLALVSFPMARQVTRPVERITRAARALGRGDLAVRTGVRHRRDELGELARTFDEMAARLERMVASEKELLANVSHELRTPLARIRVALEIAEDEDDPEAARRHLAGIGGDLAELEQLIDQVLMTARLDLASSTDGTFPMEPTPLDINGLVERSVARFRRLHPSHQLDVDLPAALPLVEGDGKLLHRVLDNLLDNASKYAPADKGPVELSVSLDAPEGAISIAVADRGIGVSDDDLPMLFEPFFRSDRSRERGTGGVGLGLALSRRIVDAHHGTIGAQIRPGGGLQVAFAIPLHVG
jgi:signal transduction histidine kinase